MSERRENFGVKVGCTTQKEVRIFRKYVQIGQRLNCMVFEGDIDSKATEEKASQCFLLKKGKYTAQTTEGTMQWTLLTIWNKRLLDDFKEEDRKYRAWRREYENSLHMQPLPGKN